MTFSLTSYRANGQVRAGVVQDGRLYDIEALTGQSEFGTIDDVLIRWADACSQIFAGLASNHHLEAINSECSGDVPLFRPKTIYCAGANYRDHMVNMARKLNIDPEPDPHAIGLSPWHFIKSSACVVGDGATVKNDSAQLDWEAELAVVIGRTGKDIAIGDVFEYVAGYTIANDLSARDRTQRPPVPIGSPFRFDWIGQKNFDGACPLGPGIVPHIFIQDPQALSVRTLVNGAEKQSSSTSLMLFSVAEQISYLSSRITLHAGDVVLTGTPAGVGAETNEFLKPGDIVRTEIETLGSLTTYIA